MLSNLRQSVLHQNYSEDTYLIFHYLNFHHSKKQFFGWICRLSASKVGFSNLHLVSHLIKESFFEVVILSCTFWENRTIQQLFLFKSINSSTYYLAFCLLYTKQINKNLIKKYFILTSDVDFDPGGSQIKVGTKHFFIFYYLLRIEHTKC